MVNFLKYCNIFQCCRKTRNNTNNSPPSPKSYLHLNDKSSYSLIESYLNKNTIFNPFEMNETNKDILNESYKKFLHEECMICLEQNYIKKCIKNTCCNCVLHSECFEEWCLKHNKIICPLCQKIY